MAGTETHYSLPLPTLPSGKRILIVRAPYYKDIADNLLAGAEAVCREVGVSHEVADVPGALEIPTAIAMAEHAGHFNGYVALGCIIRGETTHYDTVCNDSSRGLSLLGLQGLAIGNGILTVENRKQAEVRANPGDQNKGGGAAAAALHLMALRERLTPSPRKMGFAPDSEHIRIAGRD